MRRRRVISVAAFIHATSQQMGMQRSGTSRHAAGCGSPDGLRLLEKMAVAIPSPSPVLLRTYRWNMVRLHHHAGTGRVEDDLTIRPCSVANGPKMDTLRRCN